MALYNDVMCLLSGPPSCGGSVRPRQALSASSPRCVYPLTRSQEGMWIEFQTQPDSTKYNLTLEWDLKKHCGDDRLPTVADILTVINKLTSHYATLRSIIANVDGKPHMQEFSADDVDPDVRIVNRDASTISEDAMTRILRQPFQLTEELPARWVILRDAKEFRVYISGHHIVVDGMAMSLISRDFLQLLDNPNAVLPTSTPYCSMHMTEKAWTNSQSYKDACNVLLTQVRNKNNEPWPAHCIAKVTEQQPHRKIDSWSTFPKTELDGWSQQYKTSWFRIATTLVGLLVVDKSRPALGRDECLAVAFGSRTKEMMATVGHFANALPVKMPLWQCLTSPKSDRSFKSLVSATGKNLSAVKRAETVPALDVVRTCRNMNIDYQPPRVAVTYSPKLAKSECRLFPVEGSWDMFFCFLEYEEDVKLGVIYDPLVFSDESIRAMKTQFESLIELSKKDGVRIDDMLDWLPSHPNLPQSLVDSDYPVRHIHHWIDEHANTNPTAIALQCSEEGRSLTYGDLYCSSERKAKILIQKGAGRERIVLLNLRRGFQVIEWILAVLKSGAAFVYLDPDLSETAKSAIISNCEPTIIVDEDFASEFTRMHTFGPDTSDPEADELLLKAKHSTTDDDLAYMIYTSGSTGQPKGVMVEHGNISAFVKAATGVYEVGFGARVLQFSSFTFDASILEWTSALCSGATLCFASHPKQLVGDYLADVIEANRVTFMQITPTALETLPRTRDVASLRQISMGGEAPSLEIFARWHSRVNLVNSYGPTEAAIAVSFSKINKSDEMPSVLTAGHPNPGLTFYICSEDFTSVLGPGVQGEICVAGAQIARGYSKLPEVTESRFAFHPNGLRMYRTGDRGLLREDGSLLITGRIDRECKVRGYRLAPEEIESAILDADVGVQQASVQPSDDGLELVGYVAPDTVSTASLATALKKRLASYKIPQTFVATSSLPKSVSGKTDHKAVRAMRNELAASVGERNPNMSTDCTTTSDDDESVSSHVSSSHNPEREIAKIWQDVLQASSPPPPDVNFFDIGGHSLLVPRLHEKLKVTFPDKPVRLLDLFHQSTIKKQSMLFGGGEKRPVKQKKMRRKKKTRIADTPIFTPMALSAKSSRSSLQSRSSSIDEVSTQASSVASDAGEPGSSMNVSITGIAGRFPGAKNADEFYEKLIQGYSGVTETPIDRKVLPGNIWVKRAGSLDGVELFDHKFWNLSREDAMEMDPQQRLFLEVAYEALVDAGLDLQSLNGSRTGIFVGAANPGYHMHTKSVASDSFLRENRGFVAPSISARTAYHFNATGPNVTIQNNCASSTVALSLAFDALRLGRCDMAIVGGVSVQLYEGGYITKEGQIFSSRGECNPFDSRADGTVPADAVTAIVLKRCPNDSRDSGPSYAKILGASIGSDGALEKAGYQVPSPRGQAEVIKAAWQDSGRTPEKLRYAEIHGSGTPIGDALELEGMNLGVKEAGGSKTTFTVGSTKGNIGNTQHTSGLVSLIKLCKSMQKGVIPATRGFQTPNDMINSTLPIQIASHKTRLSQDDVLAVSACGWGGVNSHIILGFPDAGRHKQSTVYPPATTFSREKLAAPRLHPLKDDVVSAEASPEIVESFVRRASEVLNAEVGADDNLKEHGLDSKSYIALTKSVSHDLLGSPIGVTGLMLSNCTPRELAMLYCQRLQGREAGPVRANIVQQGSKATILCLPGSEGTFASATPLLQSLPSDVTIVTLEHPGESPTNHHTKHYLSLAQKHVSSDNLIILGMSLGGLSAINLAATLLDRGALRGKTYQLVLLDSPFSHHSIDVHDVEALTDSELSLTYIGASRGISESSGTRDQWEDAFPNCSMHVMDCGHYDIWGSLMGPSTAQIIQRQVDKA